MYRNVYESYKKADGKYVYTDSAGKVQKAHNGVYVAKNGDIYLDLNAGNHSEGLVLNTFAHELYHHVEKHAPDQAKALAEFIAKELGEENVEAAVNRQIEKARKAGYGEGFFEEQGMSAEEARQTVRDRAYSDFIADGLETMFTKGDVVQKLADLHRQDKGLFHTIRKFIRKWVSKLREFYNAGNTLSIEGRQVAELETFDKIQQMFAEALKVAGENYRTAEKTPPEAVGWICFRAETILMMLLFPSPTWLLLKLEEILLRIEQMLSPRQRKMQPVSVWLTPRLAASVFM